MSRKKRQQKAAEKKQARATAKQVVNKAKKTSRKKKATAFAQGRIYISATFNNTIISLTDVKGQVAVQSSTGRVGFKGTKKSTPFAANQATKLIIDKFEPLGLKKVDIFVKGVGPGRDSALRAIGHAGVEILSIRDVTPIPHNGPRPRKARRV